MTNIQHHPQFTYLESQHFKYSYFCSGVEEANGKINIIKENHELFGSKFTIKHQSVVEQHHRNATQWVFYFEAEEDYHLFLIL